jgi:hypothetical protein
MFIELRACHHRFSAAISELFYFGKVSPANGSDDCRFDGSPQRLHPKNGG